MSTKPATIPAPTEAPDWTRARGILEGIKTAFRLSLAGQILLGHELTELKAALGYAGRGGDRAKAQDGLLLKTWDEWCKAELGISKNTANRLIETYEAAKLRLRKLGGQPRLTVLLETPAGQLDAEARNTLSALVDRIAWADSQSAILEEFRITKRRDVLAGGDTSGSKAPADPAATARQLAFAFFSPVPADLGRLHKTLGSIRLAPDYQGFLHSLPVRSSRPDELSLETLEHTVATATQELRALEQDLAAARKAHPIDV